MLVWAGLPLESADAPSSSSPFDSLEHRNAYCGEWFAILPQFRLALVIACIRRVVVDRHGPGRLPAEVALAV